MDISNSSLPPYILVCSICKESCDGKRVVILRCGHLFHRDCTRTWFNSLRGAGGLRKCPLCQHVFFSESLIDVFPTLHVNNSIIKKIDDQNKKIAQLQTQVQELEKYKEEVDNLKTELNLQLATTTRYQNEVGFLGYQVEFEKASTAMAYERCESLEASLDKMTNKCRIVEETLESRTKYYIKRLYELSRPQNIINRYPPNSNRSDENEQSHPIDLTKKQPATTIVTHQRVPFSNLRQIDSQVASTSN